jgi:hypothetical protein
VSGKVAGGCATDLVDNPSICRKNQSQKKKAKGGPWVLVLRAIVGIAMVATWFIFSSMAQAQDYPASDQDRHSARRPAAAISFPRSPTSCTGLASSGRENRRAAGRTSAPGL